MSPWAIVGGLLAVILARPSRRRPLEKWHVTSRFGRRLHPVSGVWTDHVGTDLRAPVGTPIFAPVDGVVSERVSAHGGNIASLLGIDGAEYVFMHCSEVFDGAVKAGERVALSGDTGRVTGPHVHLEVRVKGVRRDPEEWFA